MEALLQAGANMEAKDKDGKSPLDWARMNGMSDVIKLLEAALGIAPKDENKRKRDKDASKETYARYPPLDYRQDGRQLNQADGVSTAGAATTTAAAAAASSSSTAGATPMAHVAASGVAGGGGGGAPPPLSEEQRARCLANKEAALKRAAAAKAARERQAQVKAQDEAQERRQQG